MGFLKDLAHTVGSVAGIVIAAPVYLAGEIVDSEFIKDIADTACRVTTHTGDLLGEVAEGTGKCVRGIVQQNGKDVGEGLSQVVGAGVNTAVGMGKGIINIVDQGAATAIAIAKGDTQTAIKAGKELAKVALVSTVAIGIGDVVDGFMDMEDVDDYELVENEETHYVSPHVRTLPSGREIWVDGDGNTSVHRSYGWTQTNPDFRVKA